MTFKNITLSPSFQGEGDTSSPDRKVSAGNSFGSSYKDITDYLTNHNKNHTPQFPQNWRCFMYPDFTTARVDIRIHAPNAGSVNILTDSGCDFDKYQQQPNNTAALDSSSNLK